VLTGVDGTIEVFTFREGVLSGFGHDLSLRLERFEITHTESTVEGRFWPESLVVQGAVEDRRLRPDALNPAQKAEILDNVRRRILHTDVHREARLFARVSPLPDGHKLAGTFELLGSARPIELMVHARDGRLVGDVELRPSDWGIKPYRAFLGAIRLADRVRVRFDLRDERS
jgi:YceI-like protein